MRINIVSFETGEILEVVTTRYNSVNALFENVSRWMKRHSEYKYVSAEELEAAGLEWNPKTYYVKEA